MNLEGAQAGRPLEPHDPVQPPGFLPREVFLQVITHAPLVSMDLLATDSEGRTLVGRRVNPPAAETWFAPGGRVRKGETLDAAFLRLTKAELGVALPRSAGRLIGVFEHFYDDSPLTTAGQGPSTHYVVLAYHLPLPDPTSRPLPDDQHGNWRWLAADDTAGWAEVHRYTLAYRGHY